MIPVPIIIPSAHVGSGSSFNLNDFFLFMGLSMLALGYLMAFFHGLAEGSGVFETYRSEHPRFAVWNALFFTYWIGFVLGIILSLGSRRKR